MCFTTQFTNIPNGDDMESGAFSVSFSVKDLKKSKQFYETLGFSVFAGNEDHNYLIIKNGDSLIGLFQGMFEGNILTFNPGWDCDANTLSDFRDIREIQMHLKKNGTPLTRKEDESASGPASVTLEDPYGNAILIDQHVKKV